MLKQAHTLDQRNAKTLQQKGQLMFDAGRPQLALRDFTKCSSLEPWNIDCLYYKALSSLNIGKFYQGIKDLTTKGTFISCCHLFFPKIRKSMDFFKQVHPPALFFTLYFLLFAFFFVDFLKMNGFLLYTS